jgi:hypothetical protein
MLFPSSQLETTRLKRASNNNFMTEKIACLRSALMTLVL